MGARLAMWRVRKVGDDKEEECGMFRGGATRRTGPANPHEKVLCPLPRRIDPPGVIRVSD